MKTPHKHAELIKAWADGAQIQCMDVRGKWRDVSPAWDEDLDYRIKPEPKPDVVELARAHRHGGHSSFGWCFGSDEPHNLRLTFDGETGELKAAEVLK